MNRFEISRLFVTGYKSKQINTVFSVFLFFNLWAAKLSQALSSMKRKVKNLEQGNHLSFEKRQEAQRSENFVDTTKSDWHAVYNTYRIEPFVGIAVRDVDFFGWSSHMAHNTRSPRNANFSLGTHVFYRWTDIDVKQIGDETFGITFALHYE